MTTTRLYHVPGTRSTRVLWLLEEIAAPYDVVVMAPEERKGPEHRVRHPLGRVPVLELDGGFVFESAAIVLHLADLHPEAELIGPLGSYERALAYQWTLFGMTELERLVVDYAFGREDAERAEKALAAFREAVQVVEDALDGAGYLIGGRFTVADLVVSGVLAFAQRNEMLQDSPNVEAYLSRIADRPARLRALAVKQD